MKAIILIGSPRINGNSTRVAVLLQKHFEYELPDIELEIFHVADMNLEGCNGCDYCRPNERCVMEDDASDFLDALETADMVYMVSPIYFSGVPSQCKALLDRMQPLFWKRIEIKKAGLPLPEKKPLYVYLLGDSLADDPHGYEPAITTIASSFALADFKIARVTPLIGSNVDISFETVCL